MNAIDLLGSDNITRKALTEVMELVRAGRIEAVIDRTMPLSEAAAAHRLLEDRQAIGRIVLIP